MAISKSKAVKSFLTGLSLQVPCGAISQLLRKGNDAIVFLLNSSIEGLPMGSPIRKSVDEDLYEYVGWLRIELEKRLDENKEAENTTIDAADDGPVLLPVVNRDIFQFMLAKAIEDKDADTLKTLQFTDHRTPETFLENEASMENVINAFRSTLISSYNKDYHVDVFVRRFVKAFREGDEASKDKMKIAYTFVNMLQAINLSGSLDVIAANDLGKLLGCLTSFSILDPEQYLQNKKSLNKQCESDDDSSDEEADPRPKKRRKKSAMDLKIAQKESRKDMNLILSLLYATIFGTKRLKVIAASFTIGFINALLLQDEGISKILSSLGKPLDAFKRAQLTREASGILLNSMELGSSIIRRELPSARLISDGRKRCDLIIEWARKIVISTGRGDILATELRVISGDGDSGKDDVDPNVVILMDRTPTDGDVDYKGQNLGEKESDDKSETDASDDSTAEQESGSEATNGEDLEQKESDDKHEIQSETDAGDGSIAEQESKIESPTPISTKPKAKSRRKKVKSVLPPVPENEEAADIGTKKSIASPSAECSQPAPTTNMTSPRNGAMASSSDDSNVSESPDVSTPLRRSNRVRSSSNASYSDSSVNTPSRSSSRVRSTYNASDSESSITTPRRSSRARSASNVSDSESSITTPRKSARARSAPNTSEGKSSIKTPSKRKSTHSASNTSGTKATPRRNGGNGSHATPRRSSRKN